MSDRKILKFPNCGLLWSSWLLYLAIWSMYGLEGSNYQQHLRGHVQINGKCTCPFSWEVPIQRPCNLDDLGKLGNNLLWFSGLWPRLAKSLLANYLRGTRLFLKKKGQLFQYCDKWYCIIYYVLNLRSRKELPFCFSLENDALNFGKNGVHVQVLKYKHSWNKIWFWKTIFDDSILIVLLVRVKKSYTFRLGRQHLLLFCDDNFFWQLT